MKFIKHIIQRLALLTILLASFHFASAVDERYSKPLEGRLNQLATDSFVTTQDPIFFDPYLRSISNIVGASNVVTLSFDEMANLKVPDTWGVTVVFKVIYVAGDDEEEYTDSTGNLSLYIKYDKNNPYESRASLRLNNIHQSTVRIISVTADGGSSLNDFKNGLLLENEILVTREYPFNCDNYGVDSISCIPMT